MEGSGSSNPAGFSPQTTIYPIASGNNVPKSPIEPANSLRLNSKDPMFMSYLRSIDPAFVDVAFTDLK
jgi:hypothetical protein